MAGRQFNIDRALDSDLSFLVPEWVFDELADSESHTFEDIFPSQTASNTDGYPQAAIDGRKRHNLYPITAFCLVQLRVGSTDRRRVLLQTLIDQHEQFELGQTKDPNRTNYWQTLNKLVEVGLLNQVNEGKATKYELPADREVAPAFDRTHPYNIRDRIIMDDPAPPDDAEATVWPLPDTTDRPAVIPAQLLGGRLSNPWDAGVSFVSLGVALTALYAGLASINDGFLTQSVAGILWAILSIGIAAMLVDILDQLNAGYQYSE